MRARILELSGRTCDCPAVSGYTAGGVRVSVLTPSRNPAGTQTTKSQVGGGGSLLDTYDTTARTPNSRLSDYEQEKMDRRVRRFYQRYFTGVGVGGRLRLLTLTSSDEAVAEGIDIHKSFRALKERLRRRWGRFEYMGVKEFKGDRTHVHLVFRGEYMEQVMISAMWHEIHKSPVVDVRAIWSQRGGARYMVKYLAKSMANRYWASYNWVFKGWVAWSKRVKRAFGFYPSKLLLQSLARLPNVRDSVLFRYWGSVLAWRLGEVMN